MLDMVDPKIGFAVICRCREGQQALEVLSVRRDHPSQAPGKWSFPGGKLATGEDSEEKRILAKVETQCAGGDPLGLPPLIHIIRLYNESSTKVRLQITAVSVCFPCTHLLIVLQFYCLGLSSHWPYC